MTHGNVNARFIRAGKTIASRPVGSSKLSDYLEALVLVRPHHGRSVIFRSAGNRALVDALESSGDFCRDTTVGGVFHPGRLSYRQINRTPGLHLTLEPKDRLTAHLDLAAPATGHAPDGRCVYRRSRAVRHVLLDVLPLVATARAHDHELPRRPQIPRRESWASSVPLPVLRLGRPASINRSGFRNATTSRDVPWRVPLLCPACPTHATSFAVRPTRSPVDSKNDSN